MPNLELFKGKISNVNKQVLTHTSGEIEKSDIKIKTNYSLTFGKTISGKGGGGGGKITTTHEHYTDFNIAQTAFRCEGDYIFQDGDSVILQAEPTNQGFYKIKFLKNATKNFTIGELKFTAPVEPSPIFLSIVICLFAGVGVWLLFLLGSFLVGFFIDIDKEAATYAAWEYARIGIAALFGLWAGKKEYHAQKAMIPNFEVEKAKFEKMKKEIEKEVEEYK